VRDYIHVSDIADAHVRALDHLLKQRKELCAQSSNARGYSVKEMIAAAEKVCGRSIRSEIATRRVGDHQSDGRRQPCSHAS